MQLPDPSLVVRDPAALLETTLQQWGGERDLWLFGYASLIWRPEFDFAERRLATVHGFHRALAMHSRINRGTPACPGLVFALVSGGSCRGMTYRVERDRAEQVLRTLWLREMPTGVYEPRWVRCRTGGDSVAALAFTLARSSPNYTGTLGDAVLIDTFRNACGRYGTTLDYVLDTARCLREHGIRDADVERMVALAGRHDLVKTDIR
jgi:cation transport protein ChaC